MADDKNEKTTSGVFSINNTGDVWNREIPGVSRLLQVKPENSLKDLGVLFEHHFKLVGNNCAYTKTISHTGTFQPWQGAVLEKLAFDWKVLGAQTPFHEFIQSHVFLNEVFANEKPSFIQVICPPSSADTVVVLVSPQSLAKKKDLVISLVDKALPKKDGGGSNEIELAA